MVRKVITRLLNGFSRNYWRFLLLAGCFFPGTQLVGQIAVELEKVNVLIPGVYNPLTVAISDVPDSCLLLHPSDGAIQKDGNGHYHWTLLSADTMQVSLEISDTCRNELIGTRIYRVKELPAMMLLGAYYHKKTIKSATFKAQGGVAAVIALDDIDGKFDMIGFTAQFFSKSAGEIWTGYNHGARFEGPVAARVQAVKPGDRVRFYGFSYQYPGLQQPRFSAEELVFKIE